MKNDGSPVVDLSITHDDPLDGTYIIYHSFCVKEMTKRQLMELFQEMEIKLTVFAPGGKICEEKEMNLSITDCNI